ncbi:MAG TPA: enoyl-CoA hydratase-related protein [Actinomycetota bacterium]|nr:enoyl-CoA hydratase-related protein [Actinomycetota bacterium]
MAYETVLYEVAGGVATITMNRPDARNALNATLVRELRDALRTAGRDRGVRAVVLTGAGRGFCAGQDLKDVTGDATPPTLGDHLERTLNPLARSIYELPKPTVAALNGVAAGAGASLALACDLRIASEAASMIIVFSKVGLIPDSGATWLLPRIVGQGRALEMAYLAEPVGAEEGLRTGLFNRVVPADDLASAAGELAQRLASGPTTAFSLTKRAIDRAWGSTYEQALQHEAHLQTAAGRGSDYTEGVNAFVEKRAPDFTGA